VTGPIPFVRPIRWGRVRADEAEKIVRERVKDTSKVVFSAHAFDRIRERSITQEDAYVILETGYVDGMPIKNGLGDWECIVTRRMAGSRKAGVVTIIFRDDDTLFVKTVEWMD
jgi:hypothetical protein